MKFVTWVLLLAGSMTIPALAQAPGFSIGPAPNATLPDGPNRDVAQRVCSGCHSVQIFASRGMTREQWASTVSSMVTRGAKISDQEFDQIVGYLSKTLPPGQNGQAASAA